MSLTALLIAAAASSCGTQAMTADPDAGETATPASEGQALYERYCAVCHGLNGRSEPGTNSTNLNSQGLLTIVDDQYLFDNTALGRPGANGRGQLGTKMPVFSSELGGPLTDEQIRHIVEYVRAWQTEDSVNVSRFESRGDPEAGAALYADLCSQCHGASGWSDTAPSLAGQTFQATASDSFINHVIVNGLPGTEMVGVDVEPEQAGDLIAFIRTLGTE